MYHPPRTINPQEHYRIVELNSKLESADPHKLVCILYEELLRSLDVMAAAFRQGRTLAREKHAGRAGSILLTMSASLDFERGGNLSVILDDVYRAMMAQLKLVIERQDEVKLAELRMGALGLSEAWNAIGPN
jgi:flagellar secretion chaperone FliS